MPLPEDTAAPSSSPWLTPGVKGIGGASLLADVGHEIPTSLLPSLLTSTLAVGGYTATAVLSAAIAPTTAVWQIALLRAGAWTARGIRVPARNALLADVVEPAAYGRAYGFERAMDHAPLEIRGSAFGLLAATQSFGNLAASLVAGILWTAASPSWAFTYLAAAMLVSLATFLATNRRLRDSTVLS